jgi:hypothetical protein
MKMNPVQKCLLACLAISLSALTSWAQVPRKKTDLKMADREAWRKILKWPDKYEEEFKESYTYEFPYAGLEFYSLGHAKYIVEIYVYLAAYQGTAIFMYYDETKGSASPAKLLKFKTYDLDEKGRVINGYETELAGERNFNSRTKELEIITKGRGIGDCGSLFRYRFVGGRPVPVEARVMACSNKANPITDPHKWPRVRKL